MQWYIWLILSMLMFVIEVNSFTFVFGFAGIGFLTTSIYSYYNPSDLNVQLFISIVSIIISVIIFKRNRIGDVKKTSIGQSNQLENNIGKVIKKISINSNGKIQLEEPFLGNYTWESKSDEEIEVDEKVIIKEIHGNILLVKKI
jgi:membrane protein implicated in regulation of membrane protease activity